jgi:two-component system, cell cycle sensor histidine kinase and response regulator CckA
MTGSNAEPALLVVDDEQHIRVLLRTILEQAGFNIVMAAGGAEACELFDHHGVTIRLLLTDLIMPGMSGTDLAARLLQRKHDLKVLYVSGYCETLTGPCAEAECLPKPFLPADLITKVKQVLNGSAGSGSVPS